MRRASCIKMYIGKEFWWDFLALIPMFYKTATIIFFIPFDYGLYQVLIFFVLTRLIRVN